MRVLMFLLVGLLMSFRTADAQVTVQVLEQNSVSWNGGDFRYPAAFPQITVVKIQLPQDAEIPEHCHPIPLAAYVAKGAIQITTSSGAQAVFSEGQSFIEVMNRWLGYAKRVTALEKTVYPMRPAPDGSGDVPVERPDTLSVVAELENGALATMLFSNVARFAKDSNRFEIYGSEGTIRYLMGSDTILAGKAGDADLKPVEVSGADAREWTVEADFINAVRAGKRAVEPSFWDGLKYMEMTEAIFRSAKTGQAVDLPFEQLERDDR